MSDVQTNFGHIRPRAARRVALYVQNLWEHHKFPFWPWQFILYTTIPLSKILFWLFYAMRNPNIRKQGIQQLFQIRHRNGNSKNLIKLNHLRPSRNRHVFLRALQDKLVSIMSSVVEEIKVHCDELALLYFCTPEAEVMMEQVGVQGFMTGAHTFAFPETSKVFFISGGNFSGNFN